MARYRKTSPFEDFMGIVSMLPWWAGVALAAAFYVGFHYVATQPTAPPPTGLKQLGELAAGQMWRTLATFLQYILPVACLVGAGVSAYQQHGSGGANHDDRPYYQPSRKASSPENASGSGYARQTGYAPNCPLCGSPMVKRTAKKGSLAGESFWGCPEYPRCRGTKPLQ